MQAFLALLKTFAKTYGYAVLGLLGAFLLQMVPGFTPADPTGQFLWQWALAPALVALAKVLIRLSQWDSGKLADDAARKARG